MVIPWNALGVVGGAIVFVYDRTKDRRAKAKAALEAVGAAVPPAPQFENGPADVALFTRYRGPGLETRHFDEDLKPALLAQLDARGLRHVPATSLADDPAEAAALAALGSFYMVVPLAEGQTSAGETIRHCQESGGVVLGSLSLITIAVAADYPMIVAIGGAALEKSANAGGEFAVLSKWAEPIAKTEPAPAAAADEKPIEVDGIIEGEPVKHVNGAQKSSEKVTLANIFDAAKEEGT